MFQGTLPQKAIKIVGNIVKEWDVPRTYIGCSGNFTIERAISNLLDCKITSNDVTIYSSYIGKYFSKEDLSQLKIKESYAGSCDFLKDYMITDTEKIATLMMASDILPLDGIDNRYCKRMLRGYKEQFGEMHKNLCEKLENMKTNIDSFYHGDVMKMLDEIPTDCGFISFPPFFKGGYEKMWRSLESFFEYTEPEYEVFDPSVHIKEFCNKVKKINNFIIITEREVEELNEYFSGTINTGLGKAIYFYSKTSQKHFIKQSSKETKAKPIIKITEDDEITEDIEILPITVDQFQELRALYLSTAVSKVGNPSVCYGLFCNNKLFGVFAFSNSFMLTGSDRLEKPVIYLLADFSISPTKEKNLSKLVLYCVLSKESKFLAEKTVGKRINSITTNAFSRNPVSMKYRGLFELFNRREIEKDKEGKVKKYNLSYGANIGQWSIKEGYDLWRRKSSK